MADLIDSSTGNTSAQYGTGGSAHIYGLARNAVRRTAAQGLYTGDVLGFVVEKAPTADDTSMTFKDSGATISAMDATTFTVGQVYPFHLDALTVGTGGEFIIFIP